MPIRIYALAKDLNIDSKELVEVCKKAGIHGKGSALASLEDDEVDKVKSFLVGPPKSEAAKAPPSGVPVRPTGTARSTKIPVLQTRAPSVPASSAPAAPIAKPKPIVVAQSPPLGLPVAEPEAEPSPVAPTARVEDANAPISRDDYIAPGGKDKIKVITAKADDKADDAPKAKKRRTPAINIKPTALPDVKQPTGKPTANEPKAQKPVIRLPKDALAGDKGTRPPLDELANKTLGKPPSTDRSKPPRPGAVPVGDAPLSTSKTGRRRGKGSGSATPAAGEGRGLAGMASPRANRQTSRRKGGRRVSMDDDRGRNRRTLKHTGRNTAAPRKSKAVLELPCTVRSLSETAGVGAGKVLGVLMKMGVMATINSPIEDEMVDDIALELGVEIEIKEQESLEDALLASIEEHIDDDEQLSPRPPIITFLGHVDHGKTSLLDKIIGIDVVSGEAGGITQHIRAYKIKDSEGRDIAFVDTPGHEAFTEMRARGANVTDIAVLVIAADDGVMPQTEEAISHAKAADVPIVVALNKIDLPGVDINRAMTQLTEHELTPSEWGGDVEVVQTSAITGEGVDELLETLQSIAELHELKANPDREAYGVCLEAEQEGGRGVIAKLVVQNGTLHVGDIVVCGDAHGRVKAVFDTLKPTKRIKSAGPSTAVNITGLDVAPEAGEKFYVLDDIAKAREIADRRSDLAREAGLAGTTTKVSLENFMELVEAGKLGRPDEVATLNLIVRADVRGSIEAIRKELDKLQHPEVQVKVLHAGVGGVTVGDVTLAHTSQAVVIAFNVTPDEAARQLADDRAVNIRRYDVIYKVTDEIKAMLEGKLKPEERVVELGRVLVKQVFTISRVGSVAGCYVAQGSIERGCRVRVFRDGRAIGDYALDSLRREKDDIKSVPRGMECGIKLAGFNDVKQDDVLEAYKIEEVARTL